MSFTTVNICVSILVLLSLRSCQSRPHSINERSIVKDYFNPDVFSTPEFEKGNDGKFYLKKNFHKKDSSVNYVEEDVEDRKMAEDEATTTKTTVADGKPKPMTVENHSTSSSYTEKVKAEEKTAPTAESIREEVSEMAKIETGLAPYTPVDKKLLVATKPNSKDEILDRTVMTSAGKEEKVDIGEAAHPDTRIVPNPDNFKIPVLIPISQLSFGTVSILPLPTVDASDRLPLAYDDDEIVGEGVHESEPLADASDEKEEPGLPLGDPYAPALPFTGSFLKDLKEAAAEQDAEKQTKIVDVLGKKFVMQANVLKYSRGDLGHTYVRFMSIRPLEEVDPKAAEVEKEGKEVKDVEARKKGVWPKDEILNAKKEKEIERETLKAVETQVKLKTEAPAHIPTEDSFKQYEDPYLRGIEEMIQKKHSFEGMLPTENSKEAVEEKLISSENTAKEGKIFLGRDGMKMERENSKDMKKDMEIAFSESIPDIGNKQREKKIKKEVGKAKEKIEKKKRKCKCEDIDSDDDY